MHALLEKGGGGPSTYYRLISFYTDPNEGGLFTESGNNLAEASNPYTNTSDLPANTSDLPANASDLPTDFW